MMASKRYSTLIVYLMFPIMWGLYGWNSWNGDRDGYEAYYAVRDSLSAWGMEFGYGYLNILANKLELPYQIFQILISLITLLLLFRYVIKVALFPVFSMLLYAVLFFPLDFVLMRNFLAFTIFLQGMIVLEEDGRYSRTKYFALIILATTVHQSSLVFLVFLFMPVNRAVNLSRFLVFFALFVSLYTLVRYNFKLPSSVAAHFDFYKVTLKSSLANAFVHLLSSILMILVVLGERKSIFNAWELSQRDRYLVFIMNFNVFSLFFLVLYFESEIFIRVFRVVLFVNIMHCVNSIFIGRRVYIFLIAYLGVFSFYVVSFFLLSVADNSLYPLFQNNLILNW
jgi:hypothetical protein